MTDEPTMLSDTADTAAIRLLLDGTDAVVQEIKRLHADVFDPDRTEKIAALRAEFDRKVEQLAIYAALIRLPVSEGEEPT